MGPPLLDQVTLLPGAQRLLELRETELPQRDELCGAFTGLLALRAAGIERDPTGTALDQDGVALAAGTVLSPPPRAGSLPPGEPGRGDYRLTLPVTDDEASAGTSAIGVAAAVERLSGGRLVAVPASGSWQAPLLRGLLGGLPAATVAVLANIAARELADQNADGAALAGYLAGGDAAALAPSPWSAGHFVLLVGLLDGPSGTLVLVADSYRSLGADGLHLQPVERVAAALRRDGYPPGGLLIVVPAVGQQRARDGVIAVGLRPDLWDNGSPAPAGGSAG